MRKFAKRLVTAVNCCLLALLVLTIYMQKQLPDRYSVVAGEEITFPPGYPIQMVRPTASGGVQAAQSSAGDSYHLDLKLLGTIPVKTVEVNVVERKLVTVSGAPFGIKMFTDGLMVVGMSDIPTAEGRVNPAKDAGLEVGDILKTFNGVTLTTNEQLAELMQENGDRPVRVEVKRGNSSFSAGLQPVR